MSALESGILLLTLSSYSVSWETKFSPIRSVRDEFRISALESVQVQYMIDYKSVSTMERYGHQYSAISLTDPDFCFVVSTPVIGFNPSLGVKLLSIIEVAKRPRKKVLLKFPEFSLQSTIDTKQTLSRSGLASLFAANSKCLEGVGIGLKQLELFMHSSSIEINDRGGEIG